MKIKLTSLFVSNQDHALKFYTEVLGFVKKNDIPLGKFKWLTVVSPEGPDDVELLLEPNENSVAKTYQEAIYDQRIPAISFAVKDVDKEYEGLKDLDVLFIMNPTEINGTKIAMFDDTCGNIIQIYQE